MTIATVITPRKASFNLDRSMALRTPSVSVTTEVEATPVREELVATMVTMWIVESTSDVGTVNAWAGGFKAEAMWRRECEAAASETFAQPTLGSSQPARERPLRDPSRLAASRRESPSSSTQDDCGPMTLGKAA